MTRALSQSAAARHLGIGRNRFARLVASGVIVPWMVDPDTGRALFTVDYLDAYQRRAGELAAERAAS